MAKISPKKARRMAAEIRTLEKWIPDLLADLAAAHKVIGGLSERVAWYQSVVHDGKIPAEPPAARHLSLATVNGEPRG